MVAFFARTGVVVATVAAGIAIAGASIAGVVLFAERQKQKEIGYTDIHGYEGWIETHIEQSKGWLDAHVQRSQKFFENLTKKVKQYE